MRMSSGFCALSSRRRHWASPLTTEVSRVPTATGGACQYHPFRFPWPLQQPFATSTFTQSLSPQITTTQQLSFSGIRPLQPSVPQGFPLPPKPAIPEFSSPFFLMKLRKTFPNATDVKEVSRGRLPWYPYLYL